MSIERVNAIVMRRPAVPVAIAFVAGIVVHRSLPAVPIVWGVAVCSLLFTAFLFRHRSIVASALIAIVVLLTGIWAGQLAEFRYPPNDIGLFATDEPRLASVEGQIADAPRLIEADPAGRPLPDKQSLVLSVSRVNTWHGWVDGTGRLPVTISPPAWDLVAGARVRVLGRLERPRPAMNPGGFDAAEHDRLQRVLATMHVSRPYDVRIVAQPSAVLAPVTGFRNASRNALDRGFDVGHATDRALLRALVFGDREPVLQPVQDDFVHSGTTHLLAANGSRIALLAGAIYLLCRLLRLTPRRALWALTLGIGLFGFLTMPAAEAIRPAAACVAVGFGAAGRRSADSLQILALVALAILIPRPLDLYGAGFQLSFAIVLGLILFAPRAMRFVDSLENPDRKVAESFRQPTLWRRAFRRAGRVLLNAAVLGLIAWVIVIPLAAWHFEQFNPWTVPFGLLLTPFAIAALAAGFVKIVLTLLCPPLAAAWAGGAAIFAAGLRGGVHAFAMTPFADVAITRPSPVGMIAYYALLLLPLLPWARPRWRWCARVAPVGGCPLLVCIPLCIGISAPGGGAPLRVTLLSVGAGQCAVIEQRDATPVIFDAGSSTIPDPLRTCIEPFLRHEQCRTIGAIYLSHGDFDHISAARAMVGEYGVGEVLTSPYFRLHAKESKPCAALLASLDSNGRSPHLILAGEHRLIGRDVEVQVLWPPPNANYNSNNAGLVLRVVCRGRSILFPADVQEPAQRELLKHPERLRSDVLVAPHHGSAELTTAAFVAAVNPQVILASSDERLTRKQRTFDATEHAWPILRTSRSGAITVEVTNDGKIHVRSFIGNTTIDLPP